MSTKVESQETHRISREDLLPKIEALKKHSAGFTNTHIAMILGALYQGVTYERVARASRDLAVYGRVKNQSRLRKGHGNVVTDRQDAIREFVLMNPTASYKDIAWQLNIDRRLLNKDLSDIYKRGELMRRSLRTHTKPKS